MGLKGQNKKNWAGGGCAKREREREREGALGNTYIICRGRGLGFCPAA